MNALIKKEIRLILPAWIAAMLLVAIVLPLLQLSSLNNIPYNPDFLPFPFLLGILFLSLASFGQEFSHKTFSILLSQPIPRNRIWLVKIAVLAIAYASVLLTLYICYKIYFYLRPIYNIPFPIDILTIYGLVILSGGLWATMLLRQITGAFWISILTPGFLIVMLFQFSEYFHWSQHIDDHVIATIFLLYPVAGFLWAWKMFLRAQDTQWTGGEISFAWLKKSSERTIVSSQPRHWLSALVRKEFQLHQANILIAAGVLALHLASVVTLKVHPNFENPDVKFILEQVWALWLLMPLLIGSAAVAEEQRLGIIESQLCLPVSRRMQLLIKFSVALVLSLILGAVMPPLIDHQWADFSAFFGFLVIAAVIFFISFYASTLARTTLQAIGISIGFAACLGAVIYGIGSGLNQLHRQQNESAAFFVLFLCLSGGVLLLVLMWLSFGNFKWLHENWKLWRRNFIVVFTPFAFIFISSNAIYFRVWEFLMPVEAHGPARLSNSAQVKLVAYGNTIYATLPDGRLWMETLAFDVGFNRWRGSFETPVPDRSKSQFIDGSNWVGVAVDNYEALGIQSNGSLWNLQKQAFENQNGFKPTQIGSETNWSQVASGWGNEFLLLKNDGSLWIWGTNGYNWRDSFSLSKKLKLDSFAPPTRMDNETNWGGLFSAGFACAKKDDSSIWIATGWHGANHTFEMDQSTNLDDQLSNFAASGNASWVGVKTNGELWLFWNPWNQNKSIPRKTQLGKNAKWKDAGFTDYGFIIAIRSDGTLWKWPSIYQMQNDLDSTKPLQLGNHSDWIALPPGWNSVALAADGSLWAWDKPSKYIWLAPSRRPVFIGNIFQGTVSKSQ